MIARLCFPLQLAACALASTALSASFKVTSPAQAIAPARASSSTDTVALTLAPAGGYAAVFAPEH